MSEPVVDRIAHEWVERLSDDTKRKLYEDLQNYLDSESRDCMECADNIGEAYDSFAFSVFFRVQHNLLNEIMTDDEIEERIYSE